MKMPPRIGLVHQRRFVVDEKHLITFADAEMPAVLSTPTLIAELEYTARDAVADLLDADERTVGTEVEIRHLAPTPPGFEVTCTARVLGYDAGEITFQLEASDGIDTVARGSHRRHVVRVDRIRRRVQRKQQQKIDQG